MINFLEIKKHFPEYHKHKSQWAYYYCKDIKDKPDIRKYITTSMWAYFYCREVENTPEMSCKITDGYYHMLFKKYLKCEKS